MEEWIFSREWKGDGDMVKWECGGGALGKRRISKTVAAQFVDLCSYILNKQ